MAIIDLEDRIYEIVNREDHKEFIFDFLSTYNIPKSTVTKLKSGTNNLSKKSNEFHLKNKLYFKETEYKVFEAFAKLEDEIKSLGTTPRYLLVTDYKTLLAKDTKTMETLDISFQELPLHFDFFLAWNGIEKVDFQKENPLDIKAAERFARLFDVLNKEIDSNSSSQRHALNIFLMRLLFCLFAEDTGIFKKDLFTNGIKQYTDENGQDINKYIDGLFKVLDLPLREGVDTIYKDFPYVNGQLFTEAHEPLPFNYKARKLIIECGELLEWSKINPDIFGSMIQAVATEGNRSQLGMHYTSVPNIMKVINPLFLEELKERFSEINNSWYESIEDKGLDKYKIKGIRKKHNNLLSDLMSRIRNMKFFDPACGSGNFLIITYKELRKLEIEIYELLNKINGSQMLVYDPIVNLSQFYGIEIDEFASDIAKLSLWIAEHQMNLELKDAIVNVVRATLPLKAAGDIKCANALRVDWETVCPQNLNDEIYLFGNPPYKGSKKQDAFQKEDLKNVLGKYGIHKQVDYISGWFYLGAKYIEKTNAKLAFVSTNSICQGEQVSLLWKVLLEKILINFAYTSFKWNNSAKKNAGVTVVIVGLTSVFLPTNTTKKIYTDGKMKKVNNISPYLTEGKTIIVEKSDKSISSLPKMDFGSMPRDGGGLIFSHQEYNEAIETYPELNDILWKYVGADEFIKGIHRYCLWMNLNQYEKFKNNPIIYNRMETVRNARINSKAPSTQAASKTPFRFVQMGPSYFYSKEGEGLAIIVPAFSSENRYYIPIGIESSSVIFSNKLYVIPDGSLALLGVLMSRMHMVWMKAVAGRLETRYGYSVGLVYNTFPVKKLSNKTIKEIEHSVLEILDIREESNENLATLYDRKKMPNELLEAHQKLDFTIDKLYKQTEIKNDEDRLSILLKLYEEYTESREQNGN